MSKRAAWVRLLVCAGCATVPSQRDTQAMQTAGMQGALEMMRSQMEGQQDALDLHEQGPGQIDAES